MIELDKTHQLQIIRQKMLHILTSREYTLKMPTYRLDKTSINGKKKVKRILDGYFLKHCKTKDWITSEKVYRGTSSRLRLRITMRKLVMLAEEVKAITFELDAQAKENKKNKKNK